MDSLRHEEDILARAPKKSAGAPKTAAPASPKKGTVLKDLTNGSGPTEALIVHHMRKLREHQALEEKLKLEIKASKQAIEKNAKNDGIDLKRVKRALEFDDLDPDKQVEEINQDTIYRRAIGNQVAARVELFDPGKPDNSSAANLKRAYHSGRRDGIQKRPQNETYGDLSSEAGQEYIKGYREGEAIAALGNMEKPTPRPGNTPPADTFDDEDGGEGGDEDPPAPDEE